MGAGIGGGALVGFESMISTVLSGSSAEVNMNTSVRSRRRSSPGNLRLSALKWLDIWFPLRVGRVSLCACEHRGGAGEQASSDCGDSAGRWLAWQAGGLTEQERVAGGQDLVGNHRCASGRRPEVTGRLAARTVFEQPVASGEGVYPVG